MKGHHVNASIWLDGADWDEPTLRWAQRAGLEPAATAAAAHVRVAVRRDDSALQPPRSWTPSASQLAQRHRVEQTPGAPSDIVVTVAGNAGIRPGLNTVQRGLQYGVWPTSAVQFPRFAIRGVIEGFYGPPWSHEERLDMVDFLADHDFTLFVLAPKDDASQRSDWRSLLDDDAKRRLSQIVDRARGTGIEIACCVSPGLSIRYSDADDVDRLVARFEQFIQLGVRRLGLLLDDIPSELQHVEDEAAFDSLASAHAWLSSEVAQRLWSCDAHVDLMVCPLVYHGNGDEPYVVELGHSLHPRIDLFWTGREICSRRLELLDAATFSRSTWRPPLYWDNYPVNDVAMVAELHIGPLLGRDPHLYRMSAGLVANAMDRAEASKIPLVTIGDYLRDPEGYDPDASWQRAMVEVAGPNDHEAYARFAETVLVSCLSDGDAPTLSRVLGEVGFALGEGDSVTACRLLREHAAEIDATAQWLQRPDVDNLRLQQQSAPWVATYARGAEALRVAASVIEGAAEPSALEPFRHSRAPKVFGDSLAMFSDDLVEASGGDGADQLT